MNLVVTPAPHALSNALGLERPLLARQWHPTKNGDLTPFDVVYNSGTRVWWLCERGHEWKQGVRRRSNGSPCPGCRKSPALVRAAYRDLERESRCLEVLSFARTRPSMAGSFHNELNGQLTASDLDASSLDRVWWACEKGHSWQESPLARARWRRCPTCMAEGPAPRRSLAAAYPSLVSQWHPTKNGDITPRMVSAGSMDKAWWVCEQSHGWQASIKGRTAGKGCPTCWHARRSAPKPGRSLAEQRPDLAAQWHPTKNGILTPGDVACASDKRVWWMCEQGHEWQASVIAQARKKKSCKGCPDQRQNTPAPRRSLRDTHPHLVEQWHPTKNGGLTPEMVASGSNKQVWWMCEQGHEWHSRVDHRTSKTRATGCPRCAGKSPRNATLESEFPEVASLWDHTRNEGFAPGTLSPHSNRKVWWCCDQGHRWVRSVDAQVRAKNACVACSI